MRKLLFALYPAVFLAGCAGLNVPGPQTPAPLQKTIIDDKAVVFAFQSFGMVLTLVDTLRDTGVIVPNSPRALQLQGYLRQTQTALNAASAAQKAGSLTSYTEAFVEATRSFNLAKQLLARR